MEERPKPSFKKGETVVFPGVGVMFVLDISHSDELNDFYSMARMDGSRVFVSVQRESLVGLRKLSTPVQVRLAVNCIRSGTVKVVWEWRARMLENGVRLHLGSLMDLAEIINMINQVRRQKLISMTEREFYRKVAAVFREEVEAVWGREETQNQLNGYVLNL